MEPALLQLKKSAGVQKKPGASAGSIGSGSVGAGAGAAGANVQLRSMNYAAGSAAVSPGNAPVQMERGAKRDIADPTLAKDDKGKRETHEYKRMDGKLFKWGVRAQDVTQGWLADCYLAAALSAVAQRYPGDIEDSFQEVGGGVYKVRMYELDWDTEAATAHWITVDADFPWFKDKKTWAYLQSAQKGELWPALWEKAYAKFKAGGAGDYDTIGQGGFEGDVMEAVTGTFCDYHEISRMRDDDLWTKLKKAADAGQAITAGTYSPKKNAEGKEEDDRYGKTGVYGDHAYTVMGVREKGRGRNKQRMVQLRNPWGSGEPTGNGKDDGIFEITLKQFKESYEAVTML